MCIYIINIRTGLYVYNTYTYTCMIHIHTGLGFQTRWCSAPNFSSTALYAREARPYALYEHISYVHTYIYIYINIIYTYIYIL